MAKGNDTEAAKKNAPPYIAFSTLKTLSGGLKQHGVPPRIDKSIMSNFSGAVANQLMTALRFLDLIDANEVPKTSFKKLIDAYDTEKWSAALNETLKHAYREVFTIDLATASPKLLYETFSAAYAGEGDTLRKSVTFFLNAATEAGITVSPYIMKAKKPRGPSSPRRNSAKPKPKKPARERVDENDDDGDTATQSPYEVLMHDIYAPGEMTDDQEQAVFTLARYLKTREGQK